MMDYEEFQQLEDLQVDGFNRWVRYDRTRYPSPVQVILPKGAHRNGPVAKVIGAIFWICVVVWLLGALATIL
jgi:hypothetical protein